MTLGILGGIVGNRIGRDDDTPGHAISRSIMLPTESHLLGVRKYARLSSGRISKTCSSPFITFIDSSA